MTDHSEKFPASEVKAGEAIMSPVQHVESRVRSQIMMHKDDFLAAGLTEEQAQEVAEAASERAKQEFLEKVDQDPLVKMGQALERAAQTEDEKAYVQRAKAQLEQTRANWQQHIARVRAVSEARAPENIPDDVTHLMQDRPRWGMIWDAPTDLVFDRDEQGFAYYFNLMPQAFNTDVAKSPSSDFQIRLLRELGALQPEQGEKYLREIPEASEPGEMSGSGAGSVQDMPTNLDGVKLHIGYEAYNRFVAAKIRTADFQRVVELPAQ